MATPLYGSLAREIVLGDQLYKVVISPEGIRVTRKGARKGAELKWDAVLALGQDVDPVPRPAAKSETDMPAPIAADVAREVRVATEALARAKAVLARAGSVPAALLTEMEPDRVYGRPEPRTDWYIEPLLTEAEVASILRVSRSAAARLGIPGVRIEGELRYRQSELRQYVMRHEGR